MTAQRLATVLLVLLLAACAAQPARESVGAQLAPHDGLDATLWMQASAEYRATLLGMFRVAREVLDRALDDPEWNALPRQERAADYRHLPLAIIADADETLIDNSSYQARGIRDDTVFSRESFRAWVDERRATALPGAAEFLRHASGRGVTVFYITNRDAPEEFAGTLDNLRALGFPVARDGSNLMLRGDPRAPAGAKGERRRWVGERYRVLLLLGDNLGDFVDGTDADPATRQALVDRYRDYWGERWIMLPNPSYGGWESSLIRHPRNEVGGDLRARKRSHLRYQ
ncbi:MAG TPA: HAD family acid phosphatase [Xanthomonadaceae bacterium]|nr:HAD family acid phosphatase [Xanthomonadaceae bacterium]